MSLHAEALARERHLRGTARCRATSRQPKDRLHQSVPNGLRLYQRRDRAGEAQVQRDIFDLRMLSAVAGHYFKYEIGATAADIREGLSHGQFRALACRVPF